MPAILILLLNNCFLSQLLEVTFEYAGENVNDIPQQFDSQSFTNVCALEKISELQKQCPYVGPIVRHKGSTSPVPSKHFTIKNISYFLSFLCF
jgi:hypothetical protein